MKLLPTKTGYVSFENMTLPINYNVFEENSHEGYASGRIYVGQITIYDSGICNWNVKSGNVAGYDYENGGVFVIKNRKKKGSITLTKENINGSKTIPRNIF